MADISKVKLGTIIYHIKDSIARKIMKGAGEKEAGEAGQVPAPAAGAANRYLRSDGTWQVPAASIITQDNAHRFVTDEEKTNWNGKVNTGDVVNNCTSTATNKPLSAAQGKALWEKYTQLNGEIQTANNTRVQASSNNNSTYLQAVQMNGNTLKQILHLSARVDNGTYRINQMVDGQWRDERELITDAKIRINMNADKRNANDDEFSRFGFFSGIDMENTPTKGWFQFATFPLNNNTNYAVQIGFFPQSGSYRFFIRSKYNESWEGVSWKEFHVTFKE